MHSQRPVRRIASIILTVGLITTVGTVGTAFAKEDRADTRTSLTAAPSTSSFGQPVTLTATVLFAKFGTRVPTGPVYFGAYDGNKAYYLGSAGVGSCSLTTRKCSATLVTTKLPEGNDTVGALYGGDNNFAPSSGLSSAKVTMQPPGAPNLTSAQAGNAQVALTWSAPVTGGPATSYKVYRSGSPGVPVSGPPLVSTAATSYTDTSVTNGSIYYYVISAANGGGQSPPSNELSARPSSPVVATTTCPATNPCNAGPVTSTDGSTELKMSADPSAGSQTVTVQVGGLGDMQCTQPQSGAVVAQYHTTAPDAPKIADYTTFGAAAQFAQDFYVNRPGVSVCYGSPDAFDGYSPVAGGTWANGPYQYGPATKNLTTGLFEAFLSECSFTYSTYSSSFAPPSGYLPCFDNFFFTGEGPTTHTSKVHSPASSNDPRISH
jgi:hypothetical protein